MHPTFNNEPISIARYEKLTRLLLKSSEKVKLFTDSYYFVVFYDDDTSSITCNTFALRGSTAKVTKETVQPKTLLGIITPLLVDNLWRSQPKNRIF